LEEEIKTKIDKETGLEEITLSDAQIKTYAEGLSSSTKTANFLLSEIKAKTDELKELRKAKTDAPVPQAKEESTTKLNDRLQ
jgi:hypothetical protein